MGNSMTSQCTSTRKGLLTKVTLIRTFSSVAPFMNLAALLVAKTILTVRTLE